MSTMRALVLGGTGAIGKELVTLLSSNGYETYVTSRTKRETRNNIHCLLGNAQDIDFLKIILDEKWDVIIDFMSYITIDFKDRVDLFLGSTSQYFFLSSSRVYADSKDPITEQSPRLLDVSEDAEFLSTDEYSLSKARQENLLLESGQKNWTIIRPYITYNDYRLQLGVYEKEEWLYRALHGRTIVVSEEISSRKTTMSYGGDVATGIMSLVNKENALGEIFHITVNECLSWNEILNIYLNVLQNHLGYKPQVLFVGMNSFPKYGIAKYQIKYDRLFDRHFNNNKISSYCDVDSFKSIAEGLQTSLTNFLKNPVFLPINWRIEAEHDRLTGEQTALTEIMNFKKIIVYFIYRYFEGLKKYV